LYPNFLFYTIIHKAEMGGACSTHGKNAYNMLVGKPEGKRSLGRPGHRWEDNTVIDFREIGWETVDWIHLAQERVQWALVNMVMNPWVP
jgi:hypothetical protein